MSSPLEEATEKALALPEEERMGLTLQLLGSFEAGRRGLRDLEDELIKGADSPKSEWTAADGESIRQRLRDKHGGS